MNRVQQKRQAPLPIFNKHKRPRQALVAHPKNIEPTGCAVPTSTSNSYSQTQKFNSYSTVREPSFSGWQPQENKPPFQQFDSSKQGGFIPFKPQATNFHNVPRSQNESSSNYKKNGSGFGNISFQKNPFPVSSVRPVSSVNHQKSTSERNTAYSLQQPTNRSVSWPRAASTPVVLAKEPTPSMSAQMEKSANDSGSKNHSSSYRKSKPSLRVLTATAQGMEHWSKYKQHTQFLFEVFGVLVSPVILATSYAKEFNVKTSDGIVKCVYWEMDCTLPHLVRGHMHRVVGHWDSRERILQCYSVREVRDNEEHHVKQAIEVCDESMRQFVSTLSEA